MELQIVLNLLTRVYLRRSTIRQSAGKGVDVYIGEPRAGGIAKDLDGHCPVGLRPKEGKPRGGQVHVSIVKHGKGVVGSAVVEHCQDLLGSSHCRTFSFPPNGLEMSRPARPRLVSRKRQTLGWPGRLHRVVRRPAWPPFSSRG